jgi:hypothetical protein
MCRELTLQTRAEMRVDLQVKCPLFMYDFDQDWNMQKPFSTKYDQSSSTGFALLREYKSYDA